LHGIGKYAQDRDKAIAPAIRPNSACESRMTSWQRIDRKDRMEVTDSWKVEVPASGKSFMLVILLLALDLDPSGWVVKLT